MSVFDEGMTRVGGGGGGANTLREVKKREYVCRRFVGF